MQTVMEYLMIISKLEITFSGSFAIFAVVSVLYTLYRMIKKTVQGIKLDRQEKLAQEKN